MKRDGGKSLESNDRIHAAGKKIARRLEPRETIGLESVLVVMFVFEGGGEVFETATRMASTKIKLSDTPLRHEMMRFVCEYP